MAILVGVRGFDGALPGCATPRYKKDSSLIEKLSKGINIIENKT